MMALMCRAVLKSRPQGSHSAPWAGTKETLEKPPLSILGIPCNKPLQAMVSSQIRSDYTL